MAKVGILGSGDVGKVLALGFKRHGHEVRIASREGNKLADWSVEHGVSEGTFAAVAEESELLVVVVLGRVAESLVAGIADELAGKVVIDATNPIAAAPPVGGVLQFFTGPNDSLMERLQRAAPAARFVKAFSCVGNPFMVNPRFDGGPPTMFICGNDEEAKVEVASILASFGWESEDCGPVEGARAIEPLCQLWCAVGAHSKRWTNAFKLLRR